MAWKMGAPIALLLARRRRSTTRCRATSRPAASSRGRRCRRSPMRWTSATRATSSGCSGCSTAIWRRCEAVISTERAHRRRGAEARSPTLFEKYGYVADPHTAIGYLGVPGSKRTGLCRCFSPPRIPRNSAKSCEPVIGKDVPLPDALAETLARKKVVQRIRPELGRAVEVVMIEACPRPRPPRLRSFPPVNRSTRNTRGTSARSSRAGTPGKRPSPSSTAASRPTRNTRARWRRAATSCCARCAIATRSAS